MRDLLLRLLWTLGITFAAIPLAAQVPGQRPFVRGDSNGDGQRDITDPIHTLNVLFLGEGSHACEDAADHNDDGLVDISDAIAGLGFQFLGLEPPPAPFPSCGSDPTPDPLGCEVFRGWDCDPVPTDLLNVVLEALATTSAERCCHPRMGAFSLPQGECEALGGVPLSTADLDDEAVCAPDRGPLPSEPTVWIVYGPAPVSEAVSDDAALPVTILLPESTALEAAGIEVVRIDLVLLGGEGEEGEVVGAIPLLETPVSDDLSEEQVVVEVPVGHLTQDTYRLQASGWQLDALPQGEVFEEHEGREVPVDSDAPLNRPVTPASLGPPLHIGDHLPPRLGVLEMAAIASVAPHGVLEVEDSLNALQHLSTQLEGLERTVSTPEIERLRREAGDLEDEIRRLRERIAELLRRIGERDRELEGLREDLALLELLNRILDEQLGDDLIEAIADLLRRRADVLAGTEQEDPAALSDALGEKQDRLGQVQAEIGSKQSDLGSLRARHSDMKSTIRDQFREARRAVGGSNGGEIEIRDDGVDYDIWGIWTNSSGGNPIEYGPSNDSYKEEEAELDALIEEYRELWQRILDCEAELEQLRRERAWLEQNIAKLEAAAGEVEEIDEVVDRAFDPDRFPYWHRLLERLRARGYDWLVALLRSLFDDNPPRDPAALEAWLERFAEILEAKHAEEDALGSEIQDGEDHNAADEDELEDARTAKEDAEGELEDKRGELEDEIAKATDAERQAREEARRKAEAEARRAAEEERIRELHERAQDGDADAAAELAELIGLGLLDELSGNLKLGTIVGGVLTAAETSECRCPILKALKRLLAPRNKSDGTVRAYAEAYVHEWLACGGVEVLEAFHGSDPLVDKLTEMVEGASDEALRKAAAAVERALRLSGC